MHFITLLILFTTTVFGQLNTTNREFALKTVVKPNQPRKERFADLYLTGYHTGAGLNDAVFISDPATPVKGFLNGTVGKAYHKMVVDLGSDFPYFLNMQINTNFYAAWEPVAVNVGGTNEGVPEAFWVNGTGLQWTSAPSQPRNYQLNAFGGWLVCDWWHGVPQLFFRISYYDVPAPSGCADIYLMPDYCNGTQT